MLTGLKEATTIHTSQLNFNNNQCPGLNDPLCNEAKQIIPIGRGMAEKNIRFR